MHAFRGALTNQGLLNQWLAAVFRKDVRVDLLPHFTVRTVETLDLEKTFQQI